MIDRRSGLVVLLLVCGASFPEQLLSQRASESVERARLVERTVVVRDSLFAKRSRIDPCSLARLNIDASSLDGRTRELVVAGPATRCLSSRERSGVVEFDRVQVIADTSGPSEFAVVSILHWQSEDIRSRESFVFARASAGAWRVRNVDVACCDSLPRELDRDSERASGLQVHWTNRDMQEMLVIDGHLYLPSTTRTTYDALVGRTIEGVRLVTGAEAIRQWGSRGAAGVLVITTRRDR